MIKIREEGAVLLYRCFKGLPKNGALIKYLSEPGIKPLLLETEAIYMADNNRRMPEITDDLYFVIDEKNNGIDMTDKGLDVMTGKSDDLISSYCRISASCFPTLKIKDFLPKKNKPKRRNLARLRDQGRAGSYGESAVKGVYPFRIERPICGNR